MTRRPLDFDENLFTPHQWNEDGQCDWCGAYPDEADSENCFARSKQSVISEEIYNDRQESIIEQIEKDVLQEKLCQQSTSQGRKPKN
jgi:hypothetical protein